MCPLAGPYEDLPGLNSEILFSTTIHAQPNLRFAEPEIIAPDSFCIGTADYGISNDL
jgi:hypothetical protein